MFPPPNSNPSCQPAEPCEPRGPGHVRANPHVNINIYTEICFVTTAPAVWLQVVCIPFSVGFTCVCVVWQKGGGVYFSLGWGDGRGVFWVDEGAAWRLWGLWGLTMVEENFKAQYFGEFFLANCLLPGCSGCMSTAVCPLGALSTLNRTTAHVWPWD